MLRALLLALVASACTRAEHASVAPAAQTPLADGARPNVLVILADDLGWGDLACYGHPELETPNLDRLAAEGSLFTAFYVASPTCSPSRAAFMTGRFPSELGLVKPVRRPTKRAATEEDMARLPYELPNLATALRAAGYRTIHIGKWHLGPAGEDASHPRHYGFDHARIPFEKLEDSDKRDTSLRTSAGMVDAALAALDESSDRPFYLQLWLRDPHAPLPPAPPGAERYDRFVLDHTAQPGAPAVYYAAVTELDEEVGRLLEGLGTRGLAEDTLVLFTSDNGPEVLDVPDASYSAAGSPGPFRGRKRSLYEGGIRVPLVARWPGRVPAARVEGRAVLSAVDLLPTALALAGSGPDPSWELDGEDVTDVILGASRDRARPLFYDFHFRQYGRDVDTSPSLAVREGSWMLLADPGGTSAELYDVVRDPGQTANRIADEPEVARRLFELLNPWYDSLELGADAGPPSDNRWRWPK